METAITIVVAIVVSGASSFLMGYFFELRRLKKMEEEDPEPLHRIGEPRLYYASDDDDPRFDSWRALR